MYPGTNLVPSFTCTDVIAADRDGSLTLHAAKEHHISPTATDNHAVADDLH